MKKILYTVISVTLFCLSCKKDSPKYFATSSINVVNAAVNGGPIKVNAGANSSFNYRSALNIAYNTYAVSSAFTGSNTITVVSAIDTTKTFFQRTVNLQPINTLYIFGQAPAIDTVFRVETNFPAINQSAPNPDNSMYVRFVNLSPTSSSVNVNIKSVTTNEVTALNYKGISDFIKYPALTTTPNYVFEFRDPATNVLLASSLVVPNNSRFKTMSVILTGISVPPLQVNPAPLGTIQVLYN